VADADAAAEELAAVPVHVRRSLDALWRRRLIMNVGGRYMAVGGGIAGDR
jgi:hypothetical protein